MEHKRITGRKGLALGAGLGMVVLAAAGVAWACTMYATIDMTTAPRAGCEEPCREAAPGTAASIGAQRFVPNEMVDLWWEHQGTGSRQVLGQARADGNGNLTANLIIPNDSAPGFYTVQARTVGAAFQPARSSFLVAAPQATTTEGGTGGTGGDGGGATRDAAQAGDESGPGPAVVDGGQANPAAGGSDASPPAGGGQSTGRPSEPGDRASGAQAPMSAQAPQAQAAEAPARATSTPPDRVEGGVPSERDDRAAPAPSPRSASADLWSGFGTGPRVLDGPSLAGPAPTVDRTGGGTLALGVGMLSIGLIALSMVSGLAVVRRRRASALR